LPAAVLLERDRSFCGPAWELGVADSLFAVELHPETVAFHRDLEGVPLAARAIHLLLRRDAGTNLGRHLLIRAIAVHFARADRPHPDIHLGLWFAAKIDTRIDILDLNADLLAVVVQLVRA